MKESVAQDGACIRLSNFSIAAFMGPEAYFGLLLQSAKGKGFKFAPGHGPVVPQQCPETGSGWIMGGPFWSQPIHDQAWVKGILAILEVSQD